MENKIRLNEIKIYSEGYEKIAKSLNELNRMKIITILFSMILMSYGYISWYFKIQRYQDKILINQSKNSKKN